MLHPIHRGILPVALYWWQWNVWPQFQYLPSVRQEPAHGLYGKIETWFVFNLVLFFPAAVSCYMHRTDLNLCTCILLWIWLRSINVRMVGLMHFVLRHLFGWHCQLHPIYTAFLHLMLLLLCKETIPCMCLVHRNNPEMYCMEQKNVQLSGTTRSICLYMNPFKCLKWIFDVRCQQMIAMTKHLESSLEYIFTFMLAFISHSTGGNFLKCVTINLIEMNSCLKY